MEDILKQAESLNMDEVWADIAASKDAQPGDDQ
jgi:hypothetical protein